MQEMQVRSLAREGPLEEKEMTAHSSIAGKSMGRWAWHAIVHGLAKSWALTEHVQKHKHVFARDLNKAYQIMAHFNLIALLKS